MAALLDSQNRYICGGFLVGEQWVMTSARCTNFDKVVLGAHYPTFAITYHSMAKSYKHENYTFKDSTFSNDIRLLKLQSKVRLNENIHILPLPTSSSDLSEGTACSVAGWSPNQEDCPYMPYEADGEMGDPLVCNGVAHGILSYSNPCPPAVYTRIAQYLPWIRKPWPSEEEKEDLLLLLAFNASACYISRLA
uniref:mast cell protease 2-like n=1 Tax=Podarcis muralis TaxID=64176 RepID=UPI0010A073CF|nr:mast cell protease 2-like [Podarcis muralis]